MVSNGVTFVSTSNLVGRIESERKARALELAFAHLIALTTNRKELFPVP
jgi:hypothetical protein